VADLASYRVQQGEALCGLVQALRLCTMPPPSSGLTQLMILSLYDRFMAGAATAAPGARWAAFVDAQRLAYADRDQYVGDPQFVAVPVEDLINPVYLDARAGQRPQPGVAPEPGDPGAVLRGQPLAGLWYRDSTRPLPGTSHLSIVDQQGNAVSMTATVESPFGSSRWAGGFLLNNQLTDFARDPGTPATAPANGVQAGKRPRSSMAPTMVFDADGSLRMVTGSPGGNSIVAYVAKTLVGVLRWDLSAQDAIDLPNVIARGQTVRVETGVPDGRRVAQLLGALGYEVEEREGENSGLHLIVVRNGRLEGAADPRREGRVTRVPVNPD
jgi:gamma-glutamyltranspeptidase/glutathione hydrolase